MEIHVLTIFPEMIDAALGHSIPRIAREKGVLKIVAHDLRDYTTDKHRKVDDAPFGGGPGMILKPEPVFRAVEAVAPTLPAATRKIILTPQGETFTQAKAREFAGVDALFLICGRYEGFDQRIIDGLGFELLSIGDYVLSGGEIAAMAVADAVARLLPGVLGDVESNRQESFEEGLLDFPQYTRPAEFRGMKIPEVLLSGHHEEIRKWRREMAFEETRKRRRDLLDGK